MSDTRTVQDVDREIRSHWLHHFVTLYSDPDGAELHRITVDDLLEERRALTKRQAFVELAKDLRDDPPDEIVRTR